MGLADDLDSRPVGLVSVDRLLESLDRDDRDALLRALKDRSGRNFRWSAVNLAARLAEDGYRVSHDQIRLWRWRNGA